MHPEKRLITITSRRALATGADSTLKYSNSDVNATNNQGAKRPLKANDSRNHPPKVTSRTSATRTTQTWNCNFRRKQMKGSGSFQTHFAVAAY